MNRAFRLSMCVVSCVVACDDPPADTPASPTTGVENADLRVSVDVASNGSSVLVEAEVALAGGASLRLDDGDVFTVRAADAPERPLLEIPRRGGRTPGYAVLLPTSASNVTFAFVRKTATVSATEIALPTTFSLSAPARPSRAAPIPLTWQPGLESEPFTLTIEGRCVDPNRGLKRAAAARSSGFILQPADFAPTAGACALLIEATRERASLPLDGLSAGSRAISRQVRTLTLETSP